jgi:hypothetical protein
LSEKALIAEGITYLLFYQTYFIAVYHLIRR